MKKIYILYILVFLSTMVGKAQPYYAKEFNLSSPYTIDDYIARDGITLLPGFSAVGASRDFSASIDESLIYDVDYLEGSEIPDVDDRNLFTDYEVGTAAGVFKVSGTGAATYSIPIYTPPGTGGMQPSVSVNYNSQSGNGILGLGWHIGGISAITRVPKTIYHDEVAGGITLTSEDRFALDGNRLITTGTYGADGSIYKTEKHNFATITLHDGDGDKIPDGFTVEQVDGTTMEYGGSDAIYVLNNGTSTTNLAWYIKRITDPNDNYIQYNYETDAITGEFRIRSIEYTGNSAVPKDPYNEIIFLYEERSTDFSDKYLSGYNISKHNILRAINVRSEDKLARYYKFNYSSDEDFSLLSELIVSDEKGNRFNSTVFNWSEEGSIEDELHQTILSGVCSWQYQDINGDGISELVTYPAAPSFADAVDQAFKVYKVNSDVSDFSFNHSQQCLMASGNGGPLGFLGGDFNGDGYGDVAFMRYTLSNGYIGGFEGDVAYSGGSSLNAVKYGHISANETHVSEDPTDKGYFTTTGDFNGDGISDIVSVRYAAASVDIEGTSYYRHSSRFYLGNTSSDFDEEAYGLVSSYGSNPVLSVRARDINNDNLTDLIFEMNNGIRIYYNTYGLNGSFFSFENSDFISSISFNNFFTFGDFNGDDYDEIITYASGSWIMYYNDGLSFKITPASIITFLRDESPNFKWNYYVKPPETYAVKTGDFNGDGYDDIAEFYNPDCGTAEDMLHIHYFNKNYEHKTVDNTNLMNQLDVPSGWGFAGLHYLTGGDLNGDGAEDIIMQTQADSHTDMWILNTQIGEERPLLTDISDGLNNQTTINYSSMFNTNVYTRAYVLNYPILCYKTPQKLVSGFSKFHDTEIFENTTYTYLNAKTHIQGKGFLGFAEIITKNSVNKKRVVSQSYLDLTNYQLQSQTKRTYYDTSNLETSVTINYGFIDKGDNSFFLYQNNIRTNNLLTGVVTELDIAYYDNGNLESRTNSSGNYSTTEVFTNYKKNKPQLITVTTSHPDDVNDFVDKTYFDYDDNGNIIQKIEHVSKPKTVVTNYSDFNDFGLATSKHITPSGGSTVSSSWSFDEYGRFIESRSNDFGTEYYTYDNLYGNILTHTDNNNNKTTNTYGAFGNRLSTKHPNGVTTEYNVGWANGEGPKGNGLFYTYATETGAPWQKQYFDPLGRNVQSESAVWNGITMLKEISYNTNGSVSRVNSNSDAISKTVDYDYFADGRIETETYSSGKIIKYDYSGKKVTTTIINGGGDGGDQVVERNYNNIGQLSSSTDPGGTIVYKYFAHGGTESITSNGITIKMEYDENGHQTKLIDPNSGTINYTYNSLGLLTNQTDANQNSRATYYDKYGRIDYIDDASAGITDYTYYTSGASNGLLQSTEAPNGSGVTYTYDNMGRTETVAEFFESGKEFITAYSYNDIGQLNNTTYPSGISIDYTYDDFGNIDAMHNGSTIVYGLNNNSPYRYLFYETNDQMYKSYNIVNTSNGSLKYITNTSSTNDYQKLEYDFNPLTGNLNYRKNNINTKSETFDYDNLNRLTSITGETDADIAYDNTTGSETLGNIEFKSDVGTYKYKSSRPNAVTDIINPNAGLFQLEVQDIGYNSIDKTSYIEEGVHRIDFDYGPSHSRIKATYQNSDDAGSGWSRYYGNSYELTEYANGNTKEVTYINSPAGLVAAYIEQSNGSSGWHYIFTDHLGSITGIADASGTLLEKYSYDAWGRRRNADDWTYTSITEPTLLDRGYTGHEHMDMFGLINMNGRIYDPILGRFLSPDNYIQAPGLTQSYNRYTYCLNNPLIYSDPSGEEWWHYFLSALNPIGYLQGVDKFNTGDPAQFDWDQATYQVGVQSGGGDTYYSAGWGWGSGYTPMVGYSPDYGFGGGSSSGDGLHLYFPAEQAAINYSANQTVDNAIIAYKKEYNRQLAANDGGGWFSDVWNNSAVGKIIPDVIYFNTSSAVAYLGGGSYATGYALQLKGKEGVQLYSTLTLNAKAGGHFALWSLNGGYGSYTGDSRNFSFMDTFGGEGTKGVEYDAALGAGANVSPMDDWGGRLYLYDAGVGLGVGASTNVGSVTYAKPISVPPWFFFNPGFF